VHTSTANARDGELEPRRARQADDTQNWLICAWPLVRPEQLSAAPIRRYGAYLPVAPTRVLGGVRWSALPDGPRATTCRCGIG